MPVEVLDVCGSQGCLSGTSKVFQRKLVEVAGALGVHPSDLAAIIAFETGGSFSPSQLNLWCRQAKGNDPNLCGTGLIQFMPATTRAMASKVGVALDNRALARMSGAEQLDWVKYYFRGLHRFTYRDVRDLYRTVFWPVAVGKPDDYVAIPRSSGSYVPNAGLDRGNKGYITAADIDAPVLGILSAARKRAPVLVTESSLPIFALVLGGSAGAFLAYALKTRPRWIAQLGQKLTSPPARK